MRNAVCDRSTARRTTLVRLASWVMALGLSGCGADDEALQEVSQEIRNGDALSPLERPYEGLLVYVNGCGGTLLGNSSGSARYVLTARHCTGTDAANVSVRWPNGQIPGGGAKEVWLHPAATAPAPNLVDVVLVELHSAVATSSRVYFTNLTPDELVGESARCYGAGNISGYGINQGEFEIREDSLNSDIYYNLVMPNPAGQYASNGDSGGPCVRTTGTTDATIFGIMKAGDAWTSARYTAAIAFSDWVRTFVPR